ncbi:hypothetical protein NMY22_g2652 [Coprinellus aureogranulatus]|nr:hypothetical protein NMY22_g2652 [Coprinellus aureogranulatus]
MPLHTIVMHLSVPELKSMAKVHNEHFVRGVLKGTLVFQLLRHRCGACERYAPLFIPHERKKSKPSPPTIISSETTEQFIQTLKPLSYADFSSLVDVPVESIDSYQQGARLTAIVREGLPFPAECLQAPHSVVCNPVPWAMLCHKTSRAGVDAIALYHGMKLLARLKKPEATAEFAKHVCVDCPRYSALFTPVQPMRRVRKAAKRCAEHIEKVVRAVVTDTPPAVSTTTFPPPPLSEDVNREIIREFCADLKPAAFEESGCAVCGQLTLLTNLIPLADVDCSLDPLIELGLARKERLNFNQPIEYETGPILDRQLTAICPSCLKHLENGRRPRHALANGLWLGEVPKVLADLSFVEQLLIARVRTNRYVVRISSGHSKMVGNAISFAQPMAKLYDKLPPTREDLSEVLAFIFTGIQPPGDEILKRTPMLVRRNAVAAALEWLKLNHSAYADLAIDYDTLESYPLSGVPVDIVFSKSVNGTNTIVSATSIHETEEEQGTETGPCPFKINGLIGDRLSDLTAAARSSVAAYHLRTGGHILTIGHAEEPETMYDNPALYPSIFPWLFPYGAGGFGTARVHGIVSETKHKRWLLLHHDKRFQVETRFVIIAFNHEQMKEGSKGSSIAAKRGNFHDIVSKLARLNPSVLRNISHRLQEGERVTPATQEEKDCFAVLDQVENVSTGVFGSMAGKKKMRSELWSLVGYMGAPSWFITLSPADTKHPLCFYWADKKVKFEPDLGEYREHAYIVTKNPVAGARFFHYLVELLIKHLLRWGDSQQRRGVFGHTAAYYGTVEQQGRMALHLHMLIWVACALSPQEIRDKLMNADSDFTKDIIQYLESCQVGEFANGTMEELQEKLELPRVLTPGSRRVPKPVFRFPDPAGLFPVPPPVKHCVNYTVCDCLDCVELRKWEEHFTFTVDHVIYRSNIHGCYSKIGVTSSNGEYVEHVSGKGCINKDGICTARFPRKLIPVSCIDPDGHINLKKLEQWINTINKTMAYCFGCNTDSSSLLSGTAVKATAGYVADYIVKMGLKTYEIFSAIYDVFEKQTDIWSESASDSQAARRLILKMANSLAGKIEIGGPMAAMYLLGNPDHYSSHSFVPLYWRSFVNYVSKEWANTLAHLDESPAEPRQISNSYELDFDSDVEGDVPQCDSEEGDEEDEDMVVLMRQGNRILSKCSVDDYRMRPTELSNVCLYDWIQCSVRKPIKGLKSIPTHLLEYEEPHPLRNTHRILYDVQRVKTVVPNLLGGYIPKKDGDDREFYCTTMLTLFAPWRTGLELRASNETWEAAYERHTFSPHHTKIIANINVRYECYDARDDYHHQMRLRAAEILEEAESDNEGEFPDADGMDGMELADDEDVRGTWSQRQVERMKDIEAVMQSAGWIAGDASTAEVTQATFQPQKNMSAKDWRSILTQERKRVLDSRLHLTTSTKNLQDDMDIDLRPLNDVRIVKGSYLFSEFASLVNDEEYKSAFGSAVSEFSLNREQLRAFSIVANHASSVGPEPLQMYVGGMGGTGKTRVIDSLRRFFEIRGESNRMVVLAPTGAAASVISGSTYHSFLGVATGERRSYASKAGKALDEARARMKGVEYVFIDEISMISCQDLYLIDERLKQISGLFDIPFGGVSVIVAGDFAQLPPARGPPLYSGEVSKVQLPRQTQGDQENTLGMMIWHMFVIVVMLVQNMRQIEKGHADESLRTALKHMRYKDCTDEDLLWLRSRIPAFNRTLNLGDEKWRDVSVITAWNCHKDQINSMNAARFAKDTGQTLHTFYSLDKQSTPRRQPITPRRGPRMRQRPKKKPISNNPGVRLTSAVQKVLWKQAPHTSEHIASSLSLCIGMPVMIRNNEATELSVTKGQEAIVKGWTSREIPKYPGKFALDVLFVELVKPAVPVQLPHLDQNIVPLTKISTTLKAFLPNDSVVNLTRQQVPVLLNFAMTDYCSQGKTRSVNVVDLKRSKNHQAIYVALSRGVSAEDTIILRDFSTKKITGGVSGFLREELRSLEVLNDITKLNFEGELPDGVVRRLRSSTIRAYRLWRSTGQCPTKQESNVKRKHEEDPGERPDKRLKMGQEIRSEELAQRELVNGPMGRSGWVTSWKWDSKNWSCAYDSYLTILRFVWYMYSEAVLNGELAGYSWYMSYLFDTFDGIQRGELTLDDSRLGLRQRVWDLDPSLFPRGPVGTDICSLVQIVNGLVLHDDSNLTTRLCQGCGAARESFVFEAAGRYTMMRSSLPRVLSVQEYLQHLTSSPADHCTHCGGDLMIQHEFTQLMSIQLPSCSYDVVRDHLVINRQLAIGGIAYRLTGVVYWSGEDAHFATRLIDGGGRVFKYDGMEAEGCARYEFSIKNDAHTPRLSIMEHRVASIAVYIRI